MNKVLVLKDAGGLLPTVGPICQKLNKIREVIGAPSAIVDDNNTEDGYRSPHWKSIGVEVRDAYASKMVQDIAYDV